MPTFSGGGYYTVRPPTYQLEGTRPPCPPASYAHDLTCRLLYGELQLGQRPVGRPKLRYSDNIKSVLRKCNIPESQLEALAEDRVLWSLTCATGLKNLAAAAEQAASDRRARRHAAATATPAGSVCPHCGRICASDFTLRSHLRVHL